MKKLESLKSELFTKLGSKQSLNLLAIKGGITTLDDDASHCDGKDTTVDTGETCDCTTVKGDTDPALTMGGSNTIYGVKRR